uniref:acid phosphatase type 7 n=1 Tax=Myxine glutinosa TaxID=7769 RepID=UPI00358E4F2C
MPYYEMPGLGPTLLIALVTVVVAGHPLLLQPEQVHLALKGNPCTMLVSWVTGNVTESVVEYGLLPGRPFSLRAKGSSKVFVDGGSAKRSMYIHEVLLERLVPGSRYVYHCGSGFGWSDMFNFVAMKEDTAWSPQFAIFGDMGNENAQSLARIQKDTQQGMYDVILHVGDFAYDMHEDDARVGDEFMRQIESVAAYVPYMTCPGNHEEAYNFSNYKNRFSMPGTTEGLWYSWNIGPVHMISFSTEVYFFLNYGPFLIEQQYRWLQKDLEEANRPENRKLRPWIITMGHRPMYCSNADAGKDDCTKIDSLIRGNLEKLFYLNGVDLEIWAHEHVYERLWPVYDQQVYNGSLDSPYTDPKAPVHITTGSAGCSERHGHFVPKAAAWSAFRSPDYGYTRMKVFNSTHIYLEQVSDDKDGKIIDSIWIVKNHHGVAAWL